MKAPIWFQLKNFYLFFASANFFVRHNFFLFKMLLWSFTTRLLSKSVTTRIYERVRNSLLRSLIMKYTGKQKEKPCSEECQIKYYVPNSIFLTLSKDGLIKGQGGYKWSQLRWICLEHLLDHVWIIRRKLNGIPNFSQLEHRFFIS